jgi:hypothetical protein
MTSQQPIEQVLQRQEFRVQGAAALSPTRGQKENHNHGMACSMHLTEWTLLVSDFSQDCLQTILE